MNMINSNNIFRTFLTGVPELGIFSMGLYLLETIFNLPNEKKPSEQIVFDIADHLKSEFPIFYEFARNNMNPTNLRNSIRKNLKIFVKDFRDFTNIVIVGIETAILDTLAEEMPCTNFYLVPHYEQIDEERVVSNFPKNVTLISIRDVTNFHERKSALLSYAFFCGSYGSAFVYPAVLRAIGSDVKSLYMDTIGLIILQSYTVYPHNLTAISSSGQIFTKKYNLI